MPSPSTSLHQTFLHLLHRQCRTLLHLKSLHAFTITSGLHLLHLPSILTSLLSHFPNLCPLPPPISVSYPLTLFHHLPSKTILHFNLIIRSHSLLSLPLPALHFFLLLRRLSLLPDLHTFPFALKASSLLPSPLPLLLARSLHSQSLRFGLHSHPSLSNSLISIYSSFSCLHEAHLLFLSTPHPDTVSYNSLMHAYIKSGHLHPARKLFDEMPQRDFVSWGTLLSGYAKANLSADAIELFNKMLVLGYRPDDVALVSTLSACGQLATLEPGRAVHDYIKRNRSRTPLGVYLTTALIDMYAKCGCVHEAVEVFEASSSAGRNIFTWNTIIVGIAMHGQGELALRYFERMRTEGVRPDGITFLGVLVGCSHAGMVGEARRLFEEMEIVYGVKRELKHYGCMADLLGRVGMIKEVMEMIEGMSTVRPDAYVWGGVLAGCRIHGNVEVAEIAARRLLEITPGDSGVYSIMAEIYSAARRWGDVERVREGMNGGDLRKSVAFSLIEVESVGGHAGGRRIEG